MIRAWGVKPGTEEPMVMVGLGPDDMIRIRTGEALLLNAADIDPRLPAMHIYVWGPVGGETEPEMLARLARLAPNAWLHPDAGKLDGGPG